MRNTRATGEAEISFARRFETLHIDRRALKFGPPNGCRLLACDLLGRPPPFDVTPGSPLDQFVTEASRHRSFFDSTPTS